MKTNLKTGFEITKQLVTGEAPKPAPTAAAPQEPAEPVQPKKQPQDKADDEEELL